MVALERFFGGSSEIPSFAKALERMLNPYEDVSLRVPFIFGSSYRDQKGIPPIRMLVNPQTVSFRQAKRVSQQNTMKGAVFFHWTDERGSNDDIMEMDFSGQTGNINLARGGLPKAGGWSARTTSAINKGTDWINEKLSDASNSYKEEGLGNKGIEVKKALAGANKLANFWNLYQLTREPVVDPATGFPVEYWIIYSSPLFGNTPIKFTGHFNRVMDITDDANDPFNKQYSFGFTVISSDPEMYEIYDMIVDNLSKFFLNDLE